MEPFSVGAHYHRGRMERGLSRIWRYLDRLYVSKDHQRLGIATAICDALEQQITAPSYQTHASITAKPFFTHRGYCLIREQQVERQGIYLTNYVMEKPGRQ